VPGFEPATVVTIKAQRRPVEFYMWTLDPCEPLRRLRGRLTHRPLARAGGPARETDDQLVAGKMSFTEFPLIKHCPQPEHEIPASLAGHQASHVAGPVRSLFSRYTIHPLKTGFVRILALPPSSVGSSIVLPYIYPPLKDADPRSITPHGLPSRQGREVSAIQQTERAAPHGTSRENTSG
jgi:hypothetical protein